MRQHIPQLCYLDFFQFRNSSAFGPYRGLYLNLQTCALASGSHHTTNSVFSHQLYSWKVRERARAHVLTYLHHVSQQISASKGIKTAPLSTEQCGRKVLNTTNISAARVLCIHRVGDCICCYRFPAPVCVSSTTDLTSIGLNRSNRSFMFQMNSIFCTDRFETLPCVACTSCLAMSYPKRGGTCVRFYDYVGTMPMGDCITKSLV